MMYKNETVCNAYYFKERGVPNIEYKLYTQDFTEMRDDIMNIQTLIHERFGMEVKLVIIPHVNLYSTQTNTYIPDRVELCEYLHIIYASMSDCVPPNVTLEQVLPDGLHFADHKYKNM